MVDDIEAAIGGGDADTVFFAFERYKGFESALGGRRVTAVEARGKAVLVFFAARGDDAPWCVYSHNQLYGQWRIGRSNALPTTRRQLRFAVTAEPRAARLYSASDIRLIRPDALDEVPYLAKLGPDLLNDAHVDDDRLAQQLNEARFAGRALGGRAAAGPPAGSCPDTPGLLLWRCRFADRCPGTPPGTGGGAGGAAGARQAAGA